MTLNPQAYVVGAYEHPIRKADGISLAQLHADVAKGALDDAGLSLDDVDGYFTAGDAPGIGCLPMAQYLGLRNLRYVDNTETGGSSYLFHLQHAMHAIALGKCNVALITMADNQIGGKKPFGLTGVSMRDVPDVPFEAPYAMLPPAWYAMVAQRHMYEFGTTSEQLAWVKVAASHHASHNPHALLRNVVTVDEVLQSPMVAAPLHRLDCCVSTDGGGAIVVAREDIARKINRPLVRVAGVGTAIKHNDGGNVDFSYSAGERSARDAFAEAGVKPGDVRYASLYDSFTITVIVQLEDIGFAPRGKGGAFVEDGKLISGNGPLAYNTDGGGLCSSHPGTRGGITKLLEAVRQVRGEAHPAVQVPDCELVVAHATGGSLSSYHGSATAILERR